MARKKVRGKPELDEPGEEKRCFICGATKNLVRTECCGKWICDDEADYVLFSYARNSCHRNHRRFTLCAFHHDEGHKGDWKTCPKCRKMAEPEMVVWFGTNEFGNRCPTREVRPNEMQKVGNVISFRGRLFLWQRRFTCSACYRFDASKALPPMRLVRTLAASAAVRAGL